MRDREREGKMKGNFLLAQCSDCAFYLATARKEPGNKQTVLCTRKRLKTNGDFLKNLEEKALDEAPWKATVKGMIDNVFVSR